MRKLPVSVKDELRKKVFKESCILKQGKSNNGLFYILSNQHDSSTKRYIKIIDAKQGSREGLDEIQLSNIASGARHVAKLITAGNLSNQFKYLEFEFIDGLNLSETQEDFSIEDLHKLAIQITIAITDLWHRGIIHRDIKPGNIMRDKEGNFLLVDLGIGYWMESPNKNNTKTKGSRYYSSPEQFFSATDDKVEITFSSDLYSLGMVLCEILKHRHPKMDWDEQQYGSYGEFITKTNPPVLSPDECALNPLRGFVNKILAKYKSDRFMSTQEALDYLTETRQTRRQGKVFIHHLRNNPEFIESYLDDKSVEQPDGIVLTVLETKRIDHLSASATGYKLIIDPATYRLTQQSHKSLKDKFGFQEAEYLDAYRIGKSRDNLIEKTLRLQEKSSLLILPYFALETIDGPMVSASKDIWHEGRRIANNINPSKKLYGGLVIPSSITNEDESTNKLINSTHSAYDLDGFYLIFEAPEKEKVKERTIDSKTFLVNMRKIAKSFSSMGRVIIGHSDISYMLMYNSLTLVYGWSESQRRFAINASRGGRGDTDKKLPYYIPELLTFVKGSEKLKVLGESIVSGLVKCHDKKNACTFCRQLSPFAPSTVDREALSLSYKHSMNSIISQHRDLCSTATNNIELLKNASGIAEKIKESDVSSLLDIDGKTIPSYERILSIINN